MHEFQAPWQVDEEDGLRIRLVLDDDGDDQEVQRRLGIEADRSLDRFEAREARR